MPCVGVEGRIHSPYVILTLDALFLQRGYPQFVRSDNGPEFSAKRLIRWMKSLEVKPLFSEGSPWEKGYVKSFKLEDVLRACEW